jgi:hypothetical protein
MFQRCVRRAYSAAKLNYTRGPGESTLSYITKNAWAVRVLVPRGGDVQPLQHLRDRQLHSARQTVPRTGGVIGARDGRESLPACPCRVDSNSGRDARHNPELSGPRSVHVQVCLIGGMIVLFGMLLVLALILCQASRMGMGCRTAHRLCMRWARGV